MENSMDKIDEDLEPQFRQIYTLSHLEEMSVHCKPSDMGFNFTITVGSSPFKNTSNGSRIEHNPPHAHIFIENNFSSRFIITDENPPQKKEDLKTVDESDASLSQIGDKLIEWINAEPIRSFSKGNKTNWDALRSAWMDIQDIVNQGQTNKIILHEPNNNDIQ